MNYIRYLGITERELDILSLASYGYANSQIGYRLHLSTDTVKTHLRKAYQKLGVHDRAHAVRRGFELGILTLDPPEAPEKSA